MNNKPKDQSAILERFEEEVNEHIKSLNWSKDATDYEKTLVIGNLFGFSSKIKKWISKELSLAEQRGREEERKKTKRLIKGYIRKDHILCSKCEVAEDIISDLETIKKGNQTLDRNES